MLHRAIGNNRSVAKRVFISVAPTKRRYRKCGGLSTGQSSAVVIISSSFTDFVKNPLNYEIS
jgi:hypothetical protein